MLNDLGVEAPLQGAVVFLGLDPGAARKPLAPATSAAPSALVELLSSPLPSWLCLHSAQYPKWTTIHGINMICDITRE